MRYVRFLKAQAASFAGTVADFSLTVLCVELLHVWYLPATVLGNAAGGITNFWLGRRFVFRATGQPAPAQGLRYLAVWLGSMALNAGGVWLFTQALGVNYLYSKIVVSLAVGLGFNYVLQLYFVFRKV